MLYVRRARKAGDEKDDKLESHVVQSDQRRTKEITTQNEIIKKGTVLKQRQMKVTTVIIRSRCSSVNRF